MMFRCVLFFLLAFASTALAGPWPRGAGNIFAMTSLQISAPNLGTPANYYVSNYLEYGLTKELTLGTDIGHSVSGDSKAILFLRSPIFRQITPHLFAAELGIGKVAEDFVVRPGLTYGRSFSNGTGSGWMTVDILLEHHLGRNRTDRKLDLTYGRNHRGGFKSMWQIQAGRQRGDPSFLRIAPSFALPMGPSAHFELGASVALTGGREYGLKIGLWKAF